MLWKLNINNFTFWDRLKICRFFLNTKNFWTYGNQVQLFEQKMAKYVGVKYALFVSSGSTANTLLAYYLDQVETKRKIIFPSVTWATSVTPFIKCGFEPVFVDINLNDLSMDLDQVEKILKEDTEVGTIFITALLGIAPDIDKLNYLKNKYNVRIMLDSCESTFTKYKGKNIASFFTSTTSTYFGHMLQSVEGGFVFTNDEKEYELFNMIRNHGMYRHLPIENQEKYKNPEVDPLFDFYCIGNNFRNSDIHAYIGLLDFKRVSLYTSHRKFCGELFISLLDQNSFYKVQVKNEDNLFSLPIIAKSKKTIDKIKKFCVNEGIEYRPIIGGNLLKQTAFKKYAKTGDYPNAEILNQNGMYVGLHYGVTAEQINKFVNTINKI
jgi:CDP-6-deoxy-D-xylo-4-hexulose-3-dehydrase